MHSKRGKQRTLREWKAGIEMDENSWETGIRNKAEVFVGRRLLSLIRLFHGNRHKWSFKGVFPVLEDTISWTRGVELEVRVEEMAVIIRYFSG